MARILVFQKARSLRSLTSVLNRVHQAFVHLLGDSVDQNPSGSLFFVSKFMVLTIAITILLLLLVAVPQHFVFDFVRQSTELLDVMRTFVKLPEPERSEADFF